MIRDIISVVVILGLAVGVIVFYAEGIAGEGDGTKLVNEQRAIRMLKILTSVNAQYKTMRSSYADSGASLVKAGLISDGRGKVLDDGNESGYNFTYSGAISRYGCYANPTNKESGARSFYVNESGDIRYMENSGASKHTSGGDQWSILGREALKRYPLTERQKAGGACITATRVLSKLYVLNEDYRRKHGSYAVKVSDFVESGFSGDEFAKKLNGHEAEGYVFSYSSTGKNYTCYANPVKKGRGWKSLYIDESGIMHSIKNHTAGKYDSGGKSWKAKRDMRLYHAPMKLKKGSETRAIALLEIIRFANFQYKTQKAIYATTGENLAKAGFISDQRGETYDDGEENGYNFQYAGCDNTYSCHANPKTKKDGTRSFFVNESGDIRYKPNKTGKQYYSGGEDWTVLGR